MVTRVLNVSNGDYRVSVKDSGSIVFDTRGPAGTGIGQVSIFGQLVVEGNITYINSEQLEIQDRIITLNKGEVGPGITGTHSADPGEVAGFEIIRGGQTNYSNAYLYFNEDLDHRNSAFSLTNGSFEFRIGNNRAGIFVSSINVAPNEDLYLINQGTGVLSVAGTNNYEDQVTDDDDIPNLKYLTSYVAAGNGQAAVDRFVAYDPATLTYFDTGGRAWDVDQGASESKIIFKTNQTERLKITNDNLLIPISLNAIYSTQDDCYPGIDYLRISGDAQNAILSITGGNRNIELDPAGTGKVKILSNLETTGVLQLDNQATDPPNNSSYNVVYSKSTLGMGKTGLYFTNPKTSDELISRRRALGFSMIF